ncbi:MAG: glycoside hydrolase family 38 C-terminal domain-containing protein [Candidatus Eremiobacteraeota bacterium]|nr:glycoside hydrolase family 38 C-terminal domain-containing protein [Candidatus Eremiobacteraeota bacterium]
MESLSVFIVPHTHWDREWYVPYEIFRKKLTDMLLSLVEAMEHDKEYHAFVLDGQAVILKDYLDYYPEHEERIEKLVREGRLLVGPWYTLPDEYLVSGEALVRNLLIGHKMADYFGKVMKIGYVPDSFGHISQLPQILKGFGIDHAIFTRGIGDQPRKSEYRWKGSDGTEVLATVQLLAYNNLGYLPQETAVAESRVLREVRYLQPFLSTGNVLLNHGGDHHWPQPHVVEVVRSLAGKNLFSSIRISGFEEYSLAVKKEDSRHFPTLEGELRDSRHFPILSGVLSTRMKLKLMNHAIENLLAHWAEPLATLSHLEGNAYPHRALLMAWELLLQNHAHDSICGCGTDEVFEENIMRFHKVKQLGNYIRNESMSLMCDAVSTLQENIPEGETLVIFNSLPYTRTEPVQIKLACQNLPEALCLVDEKGEEHPLQLTGKTEQEGSYPHMSRDPVEERNYAFTAGEMPPMGYRTFYLVPSKEQPGEPQPPPQEKEELAIENRFYEVGWNPIDRLYAVEKRTGRKFPYLSGFMDEADCGDEYNFSPLPGDMVLKDPLRDLTCSLVADGPVQKTIEIKGLLALPEGLAPDRKSRSATLQECPFSLRVSLFEGLERIDFSLHLKNNARDHRLKVVFPLEIGEGKLTATAEAPFDLVTRSLSRPSSGGWIEEPARTFPQGRLLLLRDAAHSLALFNKGIPEVEIHRGSKRLQVIMTLIRSVGWLSRHDIIGRGVEAGPKIPTPLAQCIDEFRFSYSLVIAEASREPEHFSAQALCFDVPLRGTFTSRHKGALPPSRSYLSVKPETLLISAFKKGEHNDSIILRLHNPSGKPLDGTLACGFPAKGYYHVTLNEERTGTLNAIDRPFNVDPKKIITLEIERQ